MNTSFKAALLTQDSRFYQEIKASDRQEQELRLNIYRNNVVVSLIDALSDIFPVTAAVVGEDFFHATARSYILENQPKSPIISEYGDTFSNFIRHFEPANKLPFLADLAALEYAILTLTNSEEHKTLDHDAVSAAFASVEDPISLQLNLPPTTQILVSPFAIGSLYQAHFSDTDQDIRHLDINSREYLLLFKSDLYGQLQVIEKDNAVFIKNLMQKKTLEEAIPEFDSFDLGTSLAKLIEWKILTTIN